MPLSWAEYILKIKEERGLSYGALARLTGTSYSYWHNQIFQVKGPPTLEKARKIAEALEIDAENFMNMVFRDRLLYYLRRQKLLEPPSKSIVTLLKSLEDWEPENGQELRGTMRIKEKRLIPQGPDIYFLGVWLRNKLWDLLIKNELPVEVEITIKAQEQGGEN